MAFPNPDGRPTGSKNRYTMERLDKRLDNIETFLTAGAIRDAGDAIAAIEFLSEGVGSGNIDPVAGRANIEKLKRFVESQARSNFSLFASGRRL